MTPLKINLVQHLGKRITHLKGGKKRKFEFAKTELLFIVLFTILCLKLASLLLFLLVLFIRHAVEELWKFCATKVVSLGAAITKSMPRLRAKLARFSVVSAFAYYCNVIILLKTGEHGNSRAKAEEHWKERVHLASAKSLAALNRALL